MTRCSISVMALLTGAGMLLTPIAARGELAYPPSQTIADRGTWLPFAPAPAQPAGICLIDSGVNLNPDTQSQVIDREALDGGSPNDVSPVEHGTLMAMEMAAPFNGWGMVGAAPTAVRIVSIRAESTTDSLTVGAYKQAIVACQDLAARHPEFNLKVINLYLWAFRISHRQNNLRSLKTQRQPLTMLGLILSPQRVMKVVSQFHIQRRYRQLLRSAPRVRTMLRVPFLTRDHSSRCLRRVAIFKRPTR